MKKLLLILLCLPMIGFGQGWEKTFGGTSTEFGTSVQQTTDGGYIICGQSGIDSTFQYDIYLLKTDANGIEQWSRTFGDPTTSKIANSIQQTTDGGYVIAGSFGGNAYILKTDANGIEQWSRTFGDTADYINANSIQQTTDGGYIISGPSSLYESFLLKTDINGQEQWIKYFNLNQEGINSNVTSDGGYIIMGWDNYIGLIKTDASGIEQWNQTLSVGFGDGGGSIQQTTDGGYIIITATECAGPFGGGEWDAICIIKTDANGIEQWVKCIGDSLYLPVSQGLAGNGKQTSDGGYIITGALAPIDLLNEEFDYIDLYLLKTDADGIEQWSRTFGDLSLTQYELGTDVQQTSDGGYIITGGTNFMGEELGTGNSDLYLIKTDGSGNITSTFNIPINPNRKLEKVVDILGKETKPQTNIPFIEIYDDGTVEKRIVIE